MKSTHLVNYHSYKKRILNYAKALDIKVEYTKLDTGGVWVPTRRTVSISEDQTKDYEIAVLLHELGHALVQASLPKTTINHLDRAYTAMHGQKCTELQIARVVHHERQAWFSGKVIARLLRIPLGSWYKRARDFSINSYIEFFREECK